MSARADLRVVSVTPRKGREVRIKGGWTYIPNQINGGWNKWGRGQKNSYIIPLRSPLYKSISLEIEMSACAKNKNLISVGVRLFQRYDCNIHLNRSQK